jgi:hypothetical protein
LSPTKPLGSLQGLFRVVQGLSGFLQGFPDFFRVLQGLSGFLQGLSGFLQGFPDFFRVPSGFL